MVPPTQLNGTSRVKPGRRDALKQVIALQRAAYHFGLALAADSEKTESREERARVATAFGNVSKAWVSLQDAKRELRGKPRLKAVEPPKRKPQRWPLVPVFTPEVASVAETVELTPHTGLLAADLDIGVNVGANLEIPELTGQAAVATGELSSVQLAALPTIPLDPNDKSRSADRSAPAPQPAVRVTQGYPPASFWDQ